MSTKKKSPAEVVCFQCHRPAAVDDGRCQFCILEAEASEAFWAVIARHFPKAKYGDLSPERTIRFSQVAVDAIEEWIGNNVPVHCKTCGSEIVATVNDGAFRDGECNGCEHQRYRSQPQLIALSEEAIEYVELVLDSSGEDSGEGKMLRRWKKLLQKANGNAA